MSIIFNPLDDLFSDFTANKQKRQDRLNTYKPSWFDTDFGLVGQFSKLKNGYGYKHVQFITEASTTKIILDVPGYSKEDLKVVLSNGLALKIFSEKISKDFVQYIDVSVLQTNHDLNKITVQCLNGQLIISIPLIQTKPVKSDIEIKID